MYFLENLILRWKRGGTIQFFWWVWCQLVFRLFNWESILFFYKDLKKNDFISNFPPQIVFRKIKRGEFERRIQKLTNLQSAIGNDFPLGCDCVIGEFRKKIVFYAWINYRRIYDHGLMDFWLPQRTAYVYRVFTIPAFRNNGIARAAYQFIFNDLSKRGFKHCLVAVSFVNQASKKSIQNAGFQRLAKLAYLNLPIVRILFFENISTRLLLLKGEKTIRELAANPR